MAKRGTIKELPIFRHIQVVKAFTIYYSLYFTFFFLSKKYTIIAIHDKHGGITRRPDPSKVQRQELELSLLLSDFFHHLGVGFFLP